jgi:hypothetical protein
MNLKSNWSGVQWHMPVVPVNQEAEGHLSPGAQDQLEKHSKKIKIKTKVLFSFLKLS